MPGTAGPATLSPSAGSAAALLGALQQRAAVHAHLDSFERYMAALGQRLEAEQAENGSLMDELSGLRSACASSSAAALGHANAMALQECLEPQLEALQQQLQQQGAAATACTDRMDRMNGVMSSLTCHDMPGWHGCQRRCVCTRSSTYVRQHAAAC
ncbi:hypothetical protein COO60DRAFT_325772 [Scenedesmus sp. NREL 46B-D3]|nr:hypothetical protein COO60DRAFT_325772 [Scenedesmus sp. NREL 46B-D3]